jgi:outer membrane protein TolC
MLYRNATFNLSNFLWYENDLPLEITDNMQPVNLQNIDFQNTPPIDSIDVIINAISVNHPEIKSLQLYVKQLDLERRLKLESLKPRVNLNYNVLSANQFTFNTNPEFVNLFNTNYKWGFDVSFPLFWGKGRGNYKLAKLKITDTEYKLQLKQLEIINKIQSYFNELIILRTQVDLYEEAAENYNRLLLAEEIKFQSGESSMFLINARQMKLLEFQSKLLEVKSKYYKALAGVAWSSGTISTQ